MRKRNTMMKEVLKNSFLCFFLLCMTACAQPTHGERQNNLLTDNTSINFELKLKNNKYIYLEIMNTTTDTLFVRTYLAIDRESSPSYIVGYEKRYKDDRGRDSIYYQWGALSTRYTFDIQERMYLFEKKEGKRPWVLFPKESVLTPLGTFFKGEYYVAIRTFFTRKKKGYITNIETNHIVVE